MSGISAFALPHSGASKTGLESMHRYHLEARFCQNLPVDMPPEQSVGEATHGNSKVDLARSLFVGGSKDSDLEPMWLLVLAVPVDSVVL